MVLGHTDTLYVVGRAVVDTILIDVGDVCREGNIRQGDRLKETISQLDVGDFWLSIMFSIRLQLQQDAIIALDDMAIKRVDGDAVMTVSQV